MRVAVAQAVKGGCLAGAFAATVVLAGCGHKQQPVLPDFADLVEEVSPSVVNISAVVPESDLESDDVAVDDSNGTYGNGADSGESQPDWLKRYLDEHGKKSPALGGDKGKSADKAPDNSAGADKAPDKTPNDTEIPEQDQADRPQSLGSGFILSADGYILTNQHVIADANEVIVTLPDRRQLPAQIIGSDERSDLALLKIEATGLPAVKIADMSKLRVGEWVLAIGTPFGFDHSVTAGIVSAKGRSLDSEQYVPFIQTDAAINPGNSGGPLFNLKGEVVGVNSQIYSQTGGFMGVAFAVPIDVATKVAAQLKAHGKVRRGYLGVVMESIDRATSLKMGMEKPIGARIIKIVPNSPAEQSGLRVGDVVLTYDGVELLSDREVPAMVGNTDPGQTATLTIFRDHKTVLIKVQVGTLEDSTANDDSDLPPAPAPLGLTVEALSNEQRRDAKVLSGGLLVTEVVDGAGRDAGVRAGDILLTIGGQDVDTPQRFAEVVDRLTPGMPVPMLVQRKGVPQYLQLRAPPRTHG
jgi:serine protease Do